MSLKKGISLCRIFAVLSIIVTLTTMIVAANIENWNDTIYMTLKISSKVSWGCFFASLFGIAILRYKSKEQKTDGKIKELEQEIVRLKKE